MPIPLLHDIPFVGEIFFNQSLPVYISFIIIGFCWWYIYCTPLGRVLRAAIGAYLFFLLQVLSIYVQEGFPSVPAQVFQVAPFPLMIFILFLMQLSQNKSVFTQRGEPSWLGRMAELFSGTTPSALGKPYRIE